MTTPTEKPDPRNRSSSDPSENWSCREDDQRSSAGPLERLEELMNQPGNRICADCGSPEPKWVSLNHGIFICIKCSGVHRSLGAHISKVLSVKLDLWTDDQVDLMVALGGNTTVNMKYEAFLQDIKKPRPDSSIEERSDFISLFMTRIHLHRMITWEKLRLISNPWFTLPKPMKTPKPQRPFS
uniref:Arf-GAP domain-containing protein n=1 Tax=Nelumbo nucifera TaxID=4432 RepID=A0A822ZDP5_NELNU|nr:TPA_asm: hypothetical protein HUJ06_000933 [Nelumbo nucifera]